VGGNQPDFQAKVISHVEATVVATTGPSNRRKALFVFGSRLGYDSAARSDSHG
jgi:hypothetical protein